jgi:protein CpxP
MSKVNRIHAIVFAAALALAVAVPIGIAQTKEASGQKRHNAERREHGKRGEGRMAGAFFRNLDLTDAQKAQMKSIRDSHSQSVRPLMEQMRAKRLEIRQASEGGTFNEALITQKLTEIAPLEAKLMGERSRLHQEMLSVLTPEQKAKLEQSREQRKTRWTERRVNKRTVR